jgi:threonine dehydrogenase-like Zn-dependent dehydrogenase
LKTTVAGSHEIDLAPLVINEISVIGSRCGRFAPALELLRRQRINVAPLVAADYGLGSIDDAFAHAGKRGIRKVLVRND